MQYTAHRSSLSNIVIACRPMQVMNGQLQWKVARLSEPDESDSEPGSTEINIPAGYKCFAGEISYDW